MGRTHDTADWKRQVVEEWLSGEKRMAQICREHNLAICLLSKWRKEDESRGETAFTTDAASDNEQVQRSVAEWNAFAENWLWRTMASKKRCASVRCGQTCLDHPGACAGERAKSA